LQLTTEDQVRNYIRVHSTSTKGVSIKGLRDAMPPHGNTFIENLEEKGDIMIMRNLTGILSPSILRIGQEFKEVPLPQLGRPNALGKKITDGGPSRWKSIWWDEIKERGRAGKRVDDGMSIRILLNIELIYAWADVQINETDDIVRLLQARTLLECD
jgi:transcription initiation factor TFIIE subunit beta